jgi:uncharacterized protein YndB with AHSA1/START domain
MQLRTVSTNIRVPRKRLFDYLTDPTTVQQWQPDVVESRPLTDGGVRPGARWRVTVEEPRRGRFELETWVIAFNPDERVVYGMDEPTSAAEIEYRLADTPTGTRVETTATFHLKGFFRFLAPLVRGMVQRKFQSRLDVLRDVAEARFSVQPLRTG